MIPRALTPAAVRDLIAKNARENPWKAGDHVRMVSGVHRGRCGTVARVDGFVAVIRLDQPWVGFGAAVREYTEVASQLEPAE